MPQVLADIAQLSTDWMSDVVGHPVTDLTIDEIVGEGYASRMYRVHLESGGSAPASVIVKLATTQKEQQQLLDRDTFSREVEFYADVSQHITDRSLLPTVYFAGADEEGLQLTLVLEDLG